MWKRCPQGSLLAVAILSQQMAQVSSLIISSCFVTRLNLRRGEEGEGGEGGEGRGERGGEKGEGREKGERGREGREKGERGEERGRLLELEAFTMTVHLYVPPSHFETSNSTSIQTCFRVSH